MKKFFSLFIILLVVVFLAGCGGNKASEEKKEVVGDQTEEQQQEVPEKSFFAKTLEEITDLGVSAKCTWNTKDASGTTYVKGEKFKSETTAEGMKFISLSDGKWMYMWQHGQQQGTKMNMEEMKKMGEDMKDSFPEEQQQGMVDMEQEYDYVCVPMPITDSVFAVPGGVQFTDMTEMMKNMAQWAEQMQQSGDLGEMQKNG